MIVPIMLERITVGNREKPKVNMDVPIERFRDEMITPVKIGDLYGVDEKGHMVVNPKIVPADTRIARIESNLIGQSSEAALHQEVNLGSELYNQTEEQLGERFSSIDKKIADIQDDGVRSKMSEALMNVIGRVDGYESDGKYPTPQIIIKGLIADRTNRYLERKKTLEDAPIEYDERGLAKPSPVVEAGKVYGDDIILLRALKGLASK